MKYLLLVHHDEEAFGRISEAKRKEMLAESVQLTHQLHDNGQYLSASPLHPARRRPSCGCVRANRS